MEEEKQVSPETKETVAPKVEQSDNKEPSWLAGRLERERKSLLRDLGVEDVKDVKSALEELKTRRESEKTETERVKSELEVLKQRVVRMSELENSVKIQSDNRLSTLTTSQKEAVLAIAGEDPAKILVAIEKLSASGMLKPDVPVQAPSTQVTVPANTSAAPAKVVPASPGKIDHLAIHESLKERNPYKAALYLDKYQKEIVAAKRDKQ